MHGGAAANIGRLDWLNGIWSFWNKSAAPFESAMDGTFTTADANYLPAAAVVNRPANGLWLEGWVGNAAGNPDKSQAFRYRLQYDIGGNSRFVSFEVNFLTGVLTASHGASSDPLQNQRVTWTTATAIGTANFHFGWWLEWNSSGVPTVTPSITREDGTTWTGAGQSLATSPSPPGELRAVHIVVDNICVEALQISQLPARPVTAAERTLTGTWTKGATLGVPGFPMLTFPKVSGDAWSVITDIARATLSTVELDRSGFVRWQDYTRWAETPTIPAVTVSSAREIAGLTVSDEIDACRNDISVRWHSWVGHTYELAGIEDKPAAAIAVPAGTTLVRSMPITEDRYDPTNPMISADLNGFGNLIIRTTASTTAPVVRGGAEFSIRRDGGTVYLTVRNRTTSTFYYHACNLVAPKPAGNTPVTALAVERDAPSQGAYGVQSYEHDGTPWVQYAEDAENLAGALLKASAVPSPQLQSVEILPDPRIDLGDVVRVVDTTGAALDTLAWVVGIRTEGSGTSVRQTLTLRGAKNNGMPTDTGLTPDPPTRPGAPPPA
ncbi:hypothetical protein [Streptomyces sp. NPDC048623]|uniref:hypothetical protein n=1 Tax=Streptomyces sp. NPDC048623 TaxID=3155761 RepID=UPI0034316B1B